MPCLRTSLAALVAAAALAQGLAAAGRPALDPTRRPAIPSQPPPPITVGPNAPIPGPESGAVQRIAAIPGWEILSFPVGRLDAARGFQRMLLRRGPEGLEAVDPVNQPRAVDPGVAYLAYFDQAATVDFAGAANDGLYRSTTLYAGWNMLGCPAGRPVGREALTLTRAGGTTALLKAVASEATAPGAAWIYSTAWTFAGGQWQPLDLRQPGVLTQPGGEALVFCWQQVELNWNLSAPAGGPPAIHSVTPTAATPGQTVTVKGQNLGAPGRGAVTVGGVPVQPEHVVSWTPSQVQFKVPPGSASGDVHVAVDRYPAGNTAPLTVQQAPAPTTTGTLEGQVFSSDGTPLQGAQVLLDDGHKSLTDVRGVFEIDNIPAGTHKAYITLIGYKSAHGEVQVQAGAARTLKVSLSPTAGDNAGAASPEKTGSFTVSAYPYNLGREGMNRYWVYKIEVWEDGNYHKRWENTWWTDNGDARYDLNCPGAPLGRSYAVVVTWRDRVGDERSNRWTPELHKDGQTFRFYDPIAPEGG